MCCTGTERFNITISKEELSLLPQASYFGEVEVVDTPERVCEAVEQLRKSRIIGFDTETRPSFRKGQHYGVALLQLSTPSKCFLFRINRIGLMPDLIELLEDENKLKVGLSVHDDFHNLRREVELNPQGFVDIQQYVKQFHIVDNSLQRIYGIIFKERISKGQRLTNWEADELTEAQQKYAAMDALACIRIYDYLKTGKFVPEKSQYLHPVVEDFRETLE